MGASDNDATVQKIRELCGEDLAAKLVVRVPEFVEYIRQLRALKLPHEAVVETADGKKIPARMSNMVVTVPEQRTLELANGTVVRAGDVLTEGSLAIRVTAVGEEDFLFKFIAMGPEWKPIDGRETAASNYPDFIWLHWLSVYPDRPVPWDESEER